MAPVLIDSSAWVEALRPKGRADLRDRVQELSLAGEARFCDQVRLELLDTAGGNRELAIVRSLESEVETLPTTPAVWQRARELARVCRNRGVSAPASDLLIAATALTHACELLHGDAHLDRILAAAADPASEG